MPTSSRDPDLAPIAAQLAVLIDAAGGDYPLISISEGLDRSDLLWMYANIIVTVAIEVDQPLLLTVIDQSCITVRVNSLARSIALLRLTESIRQEREWPYIQLDDRRVQS